MDVNDLERELQGQRKIDGLVAAYSKLLRRKNLLLHYFDVAMFEQDRKTRPPTDTEFKQLSICAQKHFKTKYPNRDFGENWEGLHCGAYHPNGKPCLRTYDTRTEVEVCRGWHAEEKVRAAKEKEDMRKVQEMIEENRQVVSDDSRESSDESGDELGSSQSSDDSDYESSEEESSEDDDCTYTESEEHHEDEC